MPRDKFHGLLRFQACAESLADRFALVSEIWVKFVNNCLRCYHLGDDITVDEKLLPSKTIHIHPVYAKQN